MTIETRYYPPTQIRGAKIRAYSEIGKVTIPYPYGESGLQAHLTAAKTLYNQLNLEWGPEFVVGSVPRGYVLTPVYKANTITLGERHDLRTDGN